MDVEATDDGVLAKILVGAGSKDVKVGRPIAVLAEEGDDISNLDIREDAEPEASEAAAPPARADEEPPSSGQKKSPAPAVAENKHEPVHFSRPAFPSVMRIAQEQGIDNPEEKIKGTGPHGMLTKGDVLAYLGKAQSPFGTAPDRHTTLTELGGVAQGKAQPAESTPKRAVELSPTDVSRMITQGLERLSRTEPASAHRVSWNDVVRDYRMQAESETKKKAPTRSFDDVVRSLMR